MMGKRKFVATGPPPIQPGHRPRGEDFTIPERGCNCGQTLARGGGMSSAHLDWCTLMTTIPASLSDEQVILLIRRRQVPCTTCDVLPLEPCMEGMDVLRDAVHPARERRAYHRGMDKVTADPKQIAWYADQERIRRRRTEYERNRNG